MEQEEVVACLPIPTKMNLFRTALEVRDSESNRRRNHKRNSDQENKIQTQEPRAKPADILWKLAG